MLENVKKAIVDVPDFPKKGIVFKDITPLLKDSRAFVWVVDQFAERYKDERIQYVVGIESRGYLLAAPLAQRLNAGLIPVRKLGKLPRATHRVTYALEYGEDTLEIHRDAMEAGARALIMDDVLATGGTARAAADLIRKCGATLVEFAFLMELGFLNGRSKLGETPLHALLQY